MKMEEVLSDGLVENNDAIGEISNTNLKFLESK